MRDITLRALDVLGAVDVVAAEDTRNTSHLLNHYNIRTRLLALHEHNERSAAAKLIAVLEAGKAVALVSDAGTPALSDPGAILVGMVREAGFPVVPVPGASAVAAAISASGLVAPHFLFYGFLPQKSAARRRELEALSALPYKNRQIRAYSIVIRKVKPDQKLTSNMKLNYGLLAAVILFSGISSIRKSSP